MHRVEETKRKKALHMVGVESIKQNAEPESGPDPVI